MVRPKGVALPVLAATALLASACSGLIATPSLQGAVATARTHRIVTQTEALDLAAAASATVGLFPSATPCAHCGHRATPPAYVETPAMRRLRAQSRPSADGGNRRGSLLIRLGLVGASLALPLAVAFDEAHIDPGLSVPVSTLFIALMPAAAYVAAPRYVSSRAIQLGDSFYFWGSVAALGFAGAANDADNRSSKLGAVSAGLAVGTTAASYALGISLSRRLRLDSGQIAFANSVGLWALTLGFMGAALALPGDDGGGAFERVVTDAPLRVLAFSAVGLYTGYQLAPHLAVTRTQMTSIDIGVVAGAFLGAMVGAASMDERSSPLWGLGGALICGGLAAAVVSQASPRPRLLARDEAAAGSGAGGWRLRPLPAPGGGVLMALARPL